MIRLWLALVLLIAFPTSGNSWTIRSSEIDLLFVVDNSGSMENHQANLEVHIHSLLSPLLEAGLEIHAGVISTDMDGLSTPSMGHLYQGFVTSGTPDFETELGRRLRLGTDGTGIEKLFDPVAAALTSPLIETVNAGFLREQATLAVIFVSDAEDQSYLTPNEFARFLIGLKGGRKDLVKVGALHVPSTAARCPRDGYEDPIKLEALLDTFGATRVGLCDVNLKARLEELGRALLP